MTLVIPLSTLLPPDRNQRYSLRDFTIGVGELSLRRALHPRPPIYFFFRPYLASFLPPFHHPLRPSLPSIEVGHVSILYSIKPASIPALNNGEAAPPYREDSSWTELAETPDELQPSLAIHPSVAAGQIPENFYPPSPPLCLLSTPSLSLPLDDPVFLLLPFRPAPLGPLLSPL